MAILALASSVYSGYEAVSSITGDDGDGARTDDQRAIDAISGNQSCPGKYKETDIRRRLDMLPMSDQRNYRQMVEATTSWLAGLLDSNAKVANAAVYRANGGANCAVNTTGEKKCAAILEQIIYQSNLIDQGSAVLPPPAPLPHPEQPVAYNTDPNSGAGAYEVYTGGGGSVSANVADDVQGEILETLEGALQGIQNTLYNVAQGAASGAEAAAQSGAQASGVSAGFAGGIDTSTLMLLGAGLAVAFIAFK